MAYLSLYRKYRPKSFDAMIGQDNIVRILRNQILFDKVGHAYIFTGTRGVGKTSCAKTFAMAVNCLNPINGSPCEKCYNCIELAKPSSLDILELDAASNNGVDEIREINEKVKYPPVIGKYKVYIIDEAHMLTNSAFNALLKTLEEPPKHCIFILATTNINKVPQTILSRCLRFDFKIVSTSVLSAHIENIFKDMGVSFEKEALTAIAVAGDGSVRDALSIADMCLSYKNDNLTYADVIEILGTNDPNIILLIASEIISKNLSLALLSFNKLLDLGKNVGGVIKDLIKVFRYMFYAKTVKETKDLFSLPEELYQKVLMLSQTISLDEIMSYIDILTKSEGDIVFASSQIAVAEMAIAHCCNKIKGFDITQLLVRLKNLEEKFRLMFEESDVKPRVKKGFDKIIVLGYLLRMLKQNNQIGTLAQLSTITPDNLDLKDGILSITIENEHIVDNLNKAKKAIELRRILSDEFECIVEVKIIFKEKYSEEKDIEIIARLFDKEILKINNTK